jgi:hypothetical protein
MKAPLLLAALVPALTSCQPGELLTAPVACTSLTAAPVVTVGPGTQPVIDWTPRCRVSEVWIEALADSASPLIRTQWGKYAEAPIYRPPVRAAIDSTLSSGPEEIFLTIGVRYKACLIDNERYAGYWDYLICTEFTP